MYSYYKDLLGQIPLRYASSDFSLMAQGKVLTIGQQINLCKPSTDADIQEAMFSIPNHKSRGPDGFSSGFFKSSWHSTVPLVCAMVKQFFRLGHIPLFISATKMIVLPKVPHPQTASDFCLISCCNVTYKVIMKLLCLRLKMVLPSLINQSQGAFVNGRQILFNVLIWQDLARGYLRKHISPRCMMKLDLCKPFDSIHWDFLEDLLKAPHFPNVFTQWIMACISNIEFHLHINGRIHGSFKGRRGLRQGDPLLPLFFVLAMEYFSWLIQKVSTHPHCKALNLTHLMFADDLLLFSKADIPTICIIKEALDMFPHTTGLDANLHKSQIFLGGCFTPLHHQCLQASGFRASTLPMECLTIGRPCFFFRKMCWKK